MILLQFLVIPCYCVCMPLTIKNVHTVLFMSMLFKIRSSTWSIPLLSLTASVSSLSVLISMRSYGLSAGSGKGHLISDLSSSTGKGGAMAYPFNPSRLFLHRHFHCNLFSQKYLYLRLREVVFKRGYP